MMEIALSLLVTIQRALLLHSKYNSFQAFISVLCLVCEDRFDVRRLKLK